MMLLLFALYEVHACDVMAAAAAPTIRPHEYLKFLTLTSRFPRFLQATIWLQLVADAPPSAVGAGGEAARELAGDGESQTLLSDVDGGGGGGYDVVREMEALEAAVVNGRRAQVCRVAAHA